MSSPRRSSFGMLLRRSKSGEMKGKKAQAAREAALARQSSVPKSPPRLPQLYNGGRAPEFDQFGSGNRPDSIAIVSGRADQPRSTPRASMEPARSVVSVPAAPPVPDFDPYARAESMTNRGRYSYASSAGGAVNSPRRVRRRKDPTPFNVLVVGTRGSGKTSFLEFLKMALALPPKKRAKDGDEPAVRARPSGNFIPHYLESEIEGERVGLTLWDSEGLEKNVVDLQLREMSAFLESKFEETFTEEMKVVRSPGVQDTHIHAVFILLDPARLDRNIAAVRAMTSNGNGKYHVPTHPVGILDEDLDLQVLRTLQGKTTVIPVIAKADTITTKHMNILKRSVWDSLKQANLDPLEVLGLEDEEDDSRPASNRIPEEEEEENVEDEVDGPAHSGGEEDDDFPLRSSDSPKSKSSKRRSTGSVRRSKTEDELKVDEIPYIPMSVISPDIYEPEVVGRKFPWGFADPNNEEHCDFLRLKESVFGEWRTELREASRDQWYEGWRTSRLKQRDGSVRRR